MTESGAKLSSAECRLRAASTHTTPHWARRRRSGTDDAPDTPKPAADTPKIPPRRAGLSGAAWDGPGHPCVTVRRKNRCFVGNSGQAGRPWDGLGQHQLVDRAGFEPAYGKPGQIYSLLPLTTRPPVHRAQFGKAAQWRKGRPLSTRRAPMLAATATNGTDHRLRTTMCPEKSRQADRRAGHLLRATGARPWPGRRQSRERSS